MTLLEVREVWKGYPAWDAGTRTLRGALVRRSPLFLRRGRQRWALQDVSFSLDAGESLAVIGHNGAGKSTLLRLASGLGRPTRGAVTVPRNTASVLSLGSWFDHDLSGRENAVTAAIVLGVSRRRAAALVPAIFEFAEIEAFADAPVRIYSDGMRLRLAFGVLAQLEPELLLVDEALAVGDLGFQSKCVERIRAMRAAGTALVLASHDLGQVTAECERAVWLHGGRVREIGPAAAVVSAYREAGRAETLARTPAGEGEGEADGPLTLHENRFGSQELTIERVALLGPTGRPADEVPGGTSLSISLVLNPRRAGLEDPVLLASIVRTADDTVCSECSSVGSVSLGRLDTPVEVTLTIDRLDLSPGNYALDLGVYPKDWAYAYDFHWHAYPLRVTGEAGGQGVLRPPYRWSADVSA